MYCPSCNAPNDSSAKFCKECGTALPTTELSKETDCKGKKSDIQFHIESLDSVDELDKLNRPYVITGRFGVTREEVYDNLEDLLLDTGIAKMNVWLYFYNGLLLNEKFGLSDTFKDEEFTGFYFEDLDSTQRIRDFFTKDDSMPFAYFTDFVNEISQLNVDDNMIAIPTGEYVATCNHCGKQWVFSDRDIKQNKRLRNASLITTAAAAGMAMKGRYVASGIWSDNATKGFNNIVDYSRCPNCNSSDVNIEARMEQRSIPANRKTGGQASAARAPKNKIVAGLLGIFLGAFGIHKFYLGYTKEALIMLGATIISLVLISFLPIVAIVPEIVGLLGLIEGIRYLTRSDYEFANTYVYGRKAWM